MNKDKIIKSVLGSDFICNKDATIRVSDCKAIIDAVIDEIKNTKKETSSKDFIDSVLQLFCNEYMNARKDEYIITNRAKDRSAIGKLIQLQKKKDPTISKEILMSNLSKTFAICATVQDKWLYNNYSPTILLSKINSFRDCLTPKNKIKTSDEFMNKLFSN